MVDIQIVWRKYRVPIVFVVLLGLVAAPLFYAMQVPIYLWDESRLAVSAAEMATNNNWLVTHFEGQPDLWNSKPPLLIWLQALSIKALGVTEWAVRLPTAAAVLFTVSLLYWFSARTLRNVPAGVGAVLVLVTSAGYFRGHVALSGDYDALLVLWELAVVVFFFRYTEQGRPRDWWWCTAALLAAVLTKGVAGLLGLPGLLLYAMWQRQLGPLFRDRKLYVSVGLFLLVVGGYYAAHEWATPGYWQAVQENEVGGRFNSALNGLGGPVSFYIGFIKNKYFLPWIAFLLPALLLAWVQPNRQQRRLTGLLVLFCLSWLLVISLAGTKLMWYEAPMYPAMALLVGLGFSWLWQAVHATYLQRRMSAQTSFLLFAAVVFALPYRSFLLDFGLTIQKKDHYHDYTIYIKRMAGAPLHLTGPVVLVPSITQEKIRSTHRDPGPDYNPVFTFYRQAYRAEMGLHLRIRNGRQLSGLQPTDTVLVCQDTLRQQLETHFVTRALHRAAPCQTLVIVGRRPAAVVAATYAPGKDAR